MKKMLAFIFATLFMLCPVFKMPVYADVSVEVPSCILIEASTGKVLYEKNADEKRHPASVTKVMTLLLVIEAIDSGKIKLTDMVSVSDNAAHMGGSQIFLEVGEEMSVDDMLKAVTVCSANDAAVALAEFVAGSEGAFVDMMNKRASELGMVNTHFENTNGLDDTTDSHLTTARDISLMSAELLSHEMIFKYTTIWQDTVRNGEFTLTNTNKLIRFYSGANGLKTGFTSKSGYCISASAKRNGMQLIAVIMGAETSDKRNVNAKKLFDYGFATYSYVNFPTADAGEIKVSGGVKDLCKTGYNSFDAVTEKGNADKVTQSIEMPLSLKAPVKRGDTVGKVVYKIGNETIGESDIYALEDVEGMTFGKLFIKFLKKYFLF